MKASQTLAVLALSALAAGACRETGEMISPGANTRVDVSSDPTGASIILDDKPTGKVTNETLRDLSIGQHQILVRMLGSNNVFYGYRTNVDVKSDSLHHVTGPLTMQCDTSCIRTERRYHNVNNIRASTLPNGALFFYDESEKGLIWPGIGSNGYAAIGTPMIAAVAGTRDTLSFGIYNEEYMAGRPSPQVATSDGRFTLRQSFWIVPTPIAFTPGVPSIRGIEVEEEVSGTLAEGDVVYVKLTFRNITNRPSYQAIDPFIPSAGINYTWVYIGFGLDGDVGAPDDDAVTYHPDLDLVYMYDHDFKESRFQAGTAERPGLIGLRLLDAPATATAKALNAWPRGFDWTAGASDGTERSGWYHFSGTRARGELAAADVPGQHIGYAPNGPGDYRMSVSAGPLTLAPGEAASITVAIVLALPVAETFVSGQAVQPENPMLGGRAIERIARDLIEKARLLVAPE